MVSGFSPESRSILLELTRSIQDILNDRLAGLCVYGSLINGGFDEGVSDVDLLAVTSEDVDDETLLHLRAMHARIAEDRPQWADRVEVAYLEAGALRSFRERRSPMITISPGEPIHRIEAGSDWLMNWYLARTHGIALIGPQPGCLIPDIKKTEFVEAVAEHGRARGDWSTWVRDRKSQAYAILTMCRALHTVTTGQHHSKQESALWAQQRFPEWSDTIATALQRRLEPADAPRHPIDADGARLLSLVYREIDRTLETPD